MQFKIKKLVNEHLDTKDRLGKITILININIL